MARRGCVSPDRYRIRGFLLICIVCAALIGAAGAVEFSKVASVADKYAVIAVTPTIFPCASGYSCMLPAAAAEKGYTISSDGRPCAYIQDSGQLTAEYCYRPPLSREAIDLSKKVYAVGSDGSGGSGGAVQTLGPIPGAAVAAAVVAKPLTIICTGNGQTYCPGWGCVDLQTNITNCGSCGYGCYNFTGCRAGKCYTDLSVVKSLPNIAAVDVGQVNPYAGIERKALNPQPLPPQPVVHAVGGAGTVNGFFSPLIAFFSPSENSLPPTPAPVAAVSRNRGIIEAILALFSPVKNEVLNCTHAEDCPNHYTCVQNMCVPEFISATADKYNTIWGDTITFRGTESTNSPSPVCMDIYGPGLPDGGWIITDSIQPNTDNSFSYAWDTGQPLAPGFVSQTDTYTVLLHIGTCSGSDDKFTRFKINLVNKASSMVYVVNVTTTPVP